MSRGHIRQRGKNSYEVKIFIGTDKSTNKKIYNYFTVKGTEKDAQKFLTQKLSELDNGIYISKKDMLFKDYLDYWFEQCCKGKLSQNTCDNYEKKIRTHIKPCLGNYKLQQLVPLHLQHFYAEKQKYLSSTTVLQLHLIIHSALNQAMKWQLINRNIADNVEKPKKASYTPVILTKEQLKTFINSIKNSELYIPIMIAISTGMRRGEILGLKWCNVDLNNSVITVNQALYKTSNGLEFLPPKSKHSYRKISIPKTLVEILKLEKQKQEKMQNLLKENYIYNDMVCCKNNGELINPNSFTPAFNKLLSKNNLPKIRFHDLRHTHASLLLEQNIPAKVISERLGHSNINTTLDLYSHVYDATNIKVANEFDRLIS